MTKQCSGVGVGLWASRAFNFVALATNVVWFHLRVFLLITDQGGDQVGCDSLVRRDSKDLTLTLHVKDYCLRHRSSLTNTKQLQRHSAYFGFIAKIAILWRDNALKI